MVVVYTTFECRRNRSRLKHCENVSYQARGVSGENGLREQHNKHAVVVEDRAISNRTRCLSLCRGMVSLTFT